MRALGLIGLLLALAIVGMTVARQLKSAGQAGGLPATPGSAPATASPRQMEQQVADDIAKALQQGAAQREKDAGQ